MYSLESYADLLRAALGRGYEFATFVDGEGRGRPRIFLRHDVDYSLEMAVELARVDASAGITSTFCLLLRSQVYNLLSDVSRRQVEAIAELGHAIALHYSAPAALPAGDAELVRSVCEDYRLLKTHVAAAAQPVFAWHNPTAPLIERGLDLEVPGMVNVYSRRFVRDIAYVSDSNLRHSVDDFHDILSRGHSAIHVLMHPLNWVAGGSDMIEILVKTWPYIIRERELDMRFNREWARYAADGIPAEVLDGFVQHLDGSLRAAGPQRDTGKE